MLGVNEGRVRCVHCPKHSASDQSDPKDRRFSISTSDLSWHCFHCGLGGSWIGFLNDCQRSAKGEAFKWAVLRGADLAGVAVPEWASRWADSHNGAGKPVKSQPSPQPLPNPPERAETSAKRVARQSDRDRNRDYAIQLWSDSVPVPTDESHPARRWVQATGAKWGCWLASCPWPRCVRWLPFEDGCGGYLVAPFARLADWMRDFPTVPNPVAIHTVCLDSHGLKSAHRGFRRPFRADSNPNPVGKIKDKASLGPYAGCGVLLSSHPGPLAIRTALPS